MKSISRLFVDRRPLAAHLVGHIERIVVRCQPHVRLLLAVRSVPAVSPVSATPRMHMHSPDEGVDLERVDVVQLLDGVLDLALVGEDVDDEHKGVVLLDLLHCRLGIQRPAPD